MNVIILSGSPRKNSKTLSVAKALKTHLDHEGASTTIIDFCEQDIPFANQGEIHANALTPFQHKLLHGWDKAKVVIILSPEYNWFPSAELVNMIHQLGDTPFRYLFDHKVFAFGAVSSGRGGRMPALQLSSAISKLVSFMECSTVISPKILETQFAHHVVDEEGNSLGNQAYEDGLRKFVKYTLQLEKMLKD